MSIGIIVILALLCFGVCRYAASRFEEVQAQGSRERPPTPHTGEEIARLFLASEGIHDVRVVVHNGMASNYFDAGRRQLYLRKEIANESNMAAWAVALHEAAHATQTEDSLDEYNWRRKVIRMTRYGPMFGLIIACGLFLLKFRNTRLLMMGFVALCVGILLMNLGTLAVEFNANARLRRFLEKHLEKWPSAQSRMDSYLSAVASREVGDLLSSPRFFFFSALPGTSKIRPTDKI